MDKSIATKAKNKSLSTDMTIMEAIDRQKPGFLDGVPKGFDGEKFVRVCKTIVRESPALQQCSIQSLLGSMMVSAQLGMELDLSEAHIIPYGNKAQFQMGYRGLLKLANNSGKIKSVHYNKICEGEDYEYEEGKNFKFSHTPNLLSDRSKIIAYYAYAHLENEGFAVHVMTLQEIQDHGKRFSRAYNAKTSPWKTDFDAMAYKTVLIQLADKKLPKATQTEAMMRLAQSVQRDSTNPLLPKDKIGVAIDMDEIIDDTDYEEVQAPVKAKPKVEVKPKPAEVVKKDEGFVPQSKKQQEISA